MKAKKILAVILSVITVMSCIGTLTLSNTSAATTTSYEKSLTTTWEYGQLNRNAASLGLNQGTNQQFIRCDFIDISNMSKITVSDSHSYRLYFYTSNDESEIAIQETENKKNTNTFDIPSNAKYMRMHLYESSKFTSLSYGDSISITGYVQVSLKNIDVSKKGSLTIYDYHIPKNENLTIRGTGEEIDNSEYLQRLGAKAIKGVTFVIKRVIDDSFTNENGDSFYTDSGVKLPDVSSVKDAISNKTGTYKVYNTYTLSPTDKDGKTTIKNLPLGIYLVQEDGETNSNISKVNDFLVSIPSVSSDLKSWNYDITTYPKTENGVKLTYDPNNTLSTDEPFTELRRANKTEPLTENQFTVSGMFFLGWSDTPTDIVPKYLDQDDFTMPDQDTTLYAIWGYTNQFRYYTQFKYSEPWGLRLSFALLNPKTSKVIDCSKYDDYGIYIYPKHEANTDMPTLQEVVTKGKKATDYTTESLTFNDGSKDLYPTTVYDEKIYTQDLDNDIYTVCYVKYKGRIFWGNVKNRCVENSVESIINDSQVGLTTYSEAEVKLATAIKGMFDAECVYYSKASASSKSYPDGKKLTNKEALSINWEQGGINKSGVKYATDNNIRSDYIDISGYSQIIINNSVKRNTYINCYRSNKAAIERDDSRDIFPKSVAENCIYKIPSEAKYVRLQEYDQNGLEPSEGNTIKVYLRKFTDGENKTFTHLTSLRAIEPWEMKLQAQPQEADFSSYDDYGVVTYTDYYNTFDKEKSLTYEDMINNDKCMLFSAKDGTCDLETFNGSQFITATSENIYTYRLQQTNVYTCFYYIKDNKCYYSDIKKRNGLDMAKKVIENKNASDEISVAAADVATKMINLYRETYFYRNGKYPTDDYDGPVWYKEDYNTPTHATIATDAKP